MLLEHLADSALGNLTKERIIDEIKSKGVINVEELYRDFVYFIEANHLNFRQQHYLDQKVNDPKDLDGVMKYIKTAREHMPKVLEKIKPVKYKDINQARRALMDVAQYTENTKYSPKDAATYQK